ncbi:MAG: Gfo/Idh/MocA family oxidoreductase [Eubacteriaceae bacterium]|nr:Gfo/Idh/MocA family oxidoreductase [Eubacteriaceae bacterium]
MNYALIGCGRISSNHIKAAIENGLEISALCDINETIIDNFITANGLDKFSIKKYTNHKEMLYKEKLDLISIAAKSGLHAEIALDCIDAGVNIIVEKPLALSLEEADEIIKRSEKMNVKVCCCHQNRFNKSVQNVYKAISEGKFGKLSHGTVHVRWNRNEDYYKQAPWRGTWAEDGGTLMNQCIHSIDIFRWMMGGEIDEVFAYTKNQFHDYIETEDVALAVVKFKNGAIGTIEGTVNVYPSNLEETLYIFGRTGTAKLGGKSLNAIDIWKFEDEKFIANDLSDTKHTGHTAVFKDMKDAIENNRAPFIDAKAGRDALELILAIHKSSKEGRAIKLPLSECKSKYFIGMF